MASTYHTVCVMMYVHQWNFLPVAESLDFRLESGALYLCGGIAFLALGFIKALTLDIVRHVSTIDLHQILTPLSKR